MAEDNFAMGYALGQDSNGGNNGGMFGNDGWWGIILLAMLFGWGGGGMGFGNYGSGMGMMLNGIATRADINEGFALNNITGGITAIQQGICDSTYALTNAVNSGFNSAQLATLQGFNGVERQLSDCCCTTQRAIDGVNYNMAKGFCDLSNVLNMQTRDIIDNQNANYRGLMDFLVQEKLSSKDAQIAQLQNRLSVSEQNGLIGARIDSAVAELLRRTGNDCPTAAYLVQPPTPVNFPTNGCGTVQFGGYGGGCGCGC